jgi:hypothetical protein
MQSGESKQIVMTSPFAKVAVEQTLPVEQLDETSRQYSIDSTAAQSALQRADTATIREGNRVWLERMVLERGQDMKRIMQDQLTKGLDHGVAQLVSAILAVVNVELKRVAAGNRRDSSSSNKPQQHQATPRATSITGEGAAVPAAVEQQAGFHSSSTSNSSPDGSGIGALTTEPTLPSAVPMQDYGMPWLIYKPLPQKEICNMVAFGYKGPYTTGLPVTVETTMFSHPCVC